MTPLPPPFIPFLRHRVREQAAMTVTELLVVIALVAVVAILMANGVTRSSALSRDVQCIANLRQFGMANLAFAEDNQRMVAAGGTWKDYWWQVQIRPYLGGRNALDDVIETLICPADETKGWGIPPATYPVMRRSYGVNNFLRAADGRIKRLTELNLHRTAYAGDTGKAPSVSSWIAGTAAFLNDIPKKRHDGKSHYVFLDGHVEAIPITALYPDQSHHYIFTGANAP